MEENLLNDNEMLFHVNREYRLKRVVTAEIMWLRRLSKETAKESIKQALSCGLIVESRDKKRIKTSRNIITLKTWISLFCKEYLAAKRK